MRNVFTHVSFLKSFRRKFFAALTRGAFAGSALALGFGAVPLTSYESHAEGVKAPEVSLDELKKLVADKSATLIDANGTSTFKEGHIPGALDFEKNEADLAKVLPKDKKSLIVAYCGGPLCVAWENAAKKIQALGYTNIKHFKGGLKVWKDSGQPLNKG